MENQKLGQEPAFPFEVYRDNQLIDNSIGMSKRLYLAGMAMQGLLSGGYATISNGMVQSSMTIRKAYELSDELLKQENQ